MSTPRNRIKLRKPPISDETSESSTTTEKSTTTNGTENKWIVCDSEKHLGRKYYFNPKTGERRWSPPPDFDSSSSSTATASDSKISTSTSTTPKKKWTKSSTKKSDANSTNTASSSSTSSKRRFDREDADEDGKFGNNPDQSSDYSSNSTKKRFRGNPPANSLETPSSNMAADFAVDGPSSGNRRRQIGFSFKNQLSAIDQSISSTNNDEQLQSFGSFAKSTPIDAEMTPIDEEEEDDGEEDIDGDQVESMEVDEIVEGINEMRKDSGGGTYEQLPPPTSTHGSDTCNWTRALEEIIVWNMVIVVDTNILLSDLAFLRDLASKTRNGLLCLVVPYTVIRELDRIKTRDRLAESARKAIAWIDDELSMRSHNVLFQSAQGDRSILHGFDVSNSDDRILKCALEITAKRKSRPGDCNTILLTNDRNLLNKARINQQMCASQKELEEYIDRLSQSGQFSTQLQSTSAQLSNSMEDALMSEDGPLVLPSVPLPVDQSIPSGYSTTGKKETTKATKSELDEIIDSCVGFLAKLIETEMKKSFDNLWTEMIKVKPPYKTLADVANVLHQHWRAVFGYVFVGYKEDYVQALYQDAKKGIKFGYSHIGQSILKRLFRLFESIHSKSEYRTAIDQISENIRTFLSTTGQ